MTAQVQEPRLYLFPFLRFVLDHASHQATQVVQDDDFFPASQSQLEQLLLLRRIGEVHRLTVRLKENFMIDD